MVTISAGSGTSGMGGALSLLSGRSTAHTGGSVSVESGEGTSTSSGVIAVRSANSGAAGASGRLVFSSGSAADWQQRCSVSRLGRGCRRPRWHGEHQRWQWHERVRVVQ